MTKKAILYARTSVEDSAKDAGSIDSQLAECRAHAESKDYSVVGTFEDDGVSGDSGILDRDGLKAARAFGKNADVIIIREFDRISRGDKGPALRGYIEWELEEAGLEVEYVKDDSTGDPVSDVILNAVKDGLAIAERLKIRERTMRGSQNHVSKGSVIVSRPAFGYRKCGDKESGRGLELDPIQSDVVKDLFHRYALEDVSMSELARDLTERKVPTARGGKWRKATVKTIFDNTSYKGLWKYGDQYVEIPAIVSEQVWDKVQSKRSHNKDTKRAQTATPFPLRGRIRCKVCGNGFTRSGNTAGPYMYLLCTRNAGGNVKESGGCECPNRRYWETEAAVFQTVMSTIQSPKHIAKVYKNMVAETDAVNSDSRNRIAALQRGLDRETNKLEKFIDLAAESNGLTAKTLKAKLGKFEVEIERLGTEIERLEATLVVTPKLNIDEISEYWEAGNFEVVRAILGDNKKNGTLLWPINEHGEIDSSDVKRLPLEEMRRLYDTLDMRVEIGIELSDIYVFTTLAQEHEGQLTYHKGQTV